MLRNHLKIAWRNLRQNKGLSVVNVLGLGIGMAFAIIIGLWIRYETSFDTFHVNGDRIGLIRKHTFSNNEKKTQVGIPLPLYEELKSNYPAIKRASRMDWGNNHSLVAGDKKLSKEGLYVDPDFLQMFTFPLVEGNIETALNDANSVVLTESLAKALFGEGNAVGKTLKVDNQYNVMVTGVVKDVPVNSSITFQFLAPFEFKVQNFDFIKNAKTQWGNNFLANVVEIREGASMEAVSKMIDPIIMQKDNTLKNQHLFLQPFKEVHLYEEYKNWQNTGGRIKYIRLFGIIGIFVLLIACINFMNLATARSEKRAKEVGIRKTVGSRRGELVLQFLSESMLTAFIAFLFSLLLIQMILPLLKDLGFEHIRFDFKDVSLLGSVLLVCLFTGVIAGSYPAFYLSSFMPLKALKGKLQQGRGAITFRKVLVVSQFVVSIALVVCTIIVFQQIQHAKNRSVGYDPNNLITINMSNDLQKNFKAARQELLNTGLVASVARASSPMTQSYNNWSGFTWEGAAPNVKDDVVFDVVMTDVDYEQTTGVKFLQGRPFSSAFATDTSAIILNRAALKVTGFKDPIGKVVKLNDKPLTVVGVIEDVINRDPFKPVYPGVLLFQPSSAFIMLVRLKPQADLRKALGAIQPVIERHNPAYPFEYSFVDEEFAKKFTTENQAGQLAAVFAVLAIFISCLGLFGLAAFMAERRTKEIGIRKVMGASVANLWMLLSKEFVLLVLLACSIASPLALWLMHEWLAQYDYRIDINWWVFVVAGVLSLLIALSTVSFQAIRAALVNPVKSLRAE